MTSDYTTNLEELERARVQLRRRILQTRHNHEDVTVLQILRDTLATFEHLVERVDSTERRNRQFREDIKREFDALRYNSEGRMNEQASAIRELWDQTRLLHAAASNASDMEIA